MNKEEMVYAMDAVDQFAVAMKMEIRNNEHKGPWAGMETEDLVLGALKNLLQVINAEEELSRVDAATHAAMYCFFIADNEAEAVMDSMRKDADLEEFGRFLRDALENVECE